ncbi:MAG: tRNA pseudouridine(13) synthase TruD [Halothiobacillaceae bacterium]
MLRGVIRDRPEDFFVDEILGFTPDGQGEHLWLRIEKTAQNTEWLVRQIARVFSVRPRDVGYAGLKDRHAVTRQWFSVPTAGDATPLKNADLPGLRLLEVARHGRKLRRGSHCANRFELVVRQLEREDPGFSGRVECIEATGVPNYFTGQRFGHQGSNLDRAAEWLGQDKPARLPRDRAARHLSVARSAIFNAVAAERVRAGTWWSPIEGDRVMLAGSRSRFLATADELPALQARAEAGDLAPTGPLWGIGDAEVAGVVARIESQCAERFAPLASGLARMRVESDRRPLRLGVQGLHIERLDDRLRLRFDLPPGGYALAVLRELVAFRDAREPESRP